jgi:hypothetical protein
MIAGARERPGGFELGEGKYYEAAILAKLDLATGEFERLLCKEDGGENYPATHPNLQFTSGCLDGDTLWLPTDTEVFHYQLPDFVLLGKISHPCFQNVHSAHVFGDCLAVTSTGLDNVVLMDKTTGAINRVINTEGHNPWYRFDPEVDYRLVHSTRPHHSHPNFVFLLDGRLWVTRCALDDAACLDDPTMRIDLAGGEDISVHDGYWWRELLVFSRVDGQLIFYDPERESLDTVDLFAGERNRPRGWCRGIHIAGDVLYAGISRLRRTKLRSRLKYLSRGNFRYQSGNQSLVIAFDLQERRLLRSYECPENFIDAIYSIVPWGYS